MTDDEPCQEIETIKTGMLAGKKCEVKGPHEIHRVYLPGGHSSWRTPKEKKEE